MHFYRGDSRPYAGLKPHGFEARQPMSAQEARDYVDSNARALGANGFAQMLRESRNGKVIATAAHLDGAYQQENNLYRITPTGTLIFAVIDQQGNRGLPINEANLRPMDCFVVYDDPLWQNATMIAFGHPRINFTKEVTFLTKIPMSFISGVKSGVNTSRNEVPFAPMLTKPGNTF